MASVIAQAAMDVISGLDREEDDAIRFCLDGRLKIVAENLGIPVEYAISCFWKFVNYRLKIKADGLRNRIRDDETGKTFSEMHKEIKKLKEDLKASRKISK